MADPEENLSEQERPEWLPSKFESPEALAESYQNLEREFTQTREHVKAMEENYQLLAQQIEESNNQQQTPQVDPADAQAQLYAMWETDPVGTQAAIAQQAARNELQQWMQQQQAQIQPQQEAQAALIAQYATREMQAKYSDFDTERERVSQVIETNPRFQNENLWANPATATQALDEAYKLVKAEDLLAGKLPATSGYDADAAKRAAQTATGGNPRPDSPDAQKQAWEAVKNASAASYSELMGR